MRNPNIKYHFYETIKFIHIFSRALFQKLLKLQKLGTYNIKNITKN